MPTQKDVKATRKLKRKATKVNNRRRNVGKQPLSFKHFYKTSHKRTRNQFESKNRNNNHSQFRSSPNKKRKFNNNNNNNAPFGFGKNIDETDPEYQRFLGDINQTDSDHDDEDDADDADHADTDTIFRSIEDVKASDLMAENEEIKNEIKQHQSALESLKNADPEFFKHLQEMDGNLLSFGDNDQFDLGDLGDIDDAVTEIQKQKILKTKNEIQINDDDDDGNDDGNDGDDDIDDDEDIDNFMDDDDDRESSNDINHDINDNNNDDVQFSDGGSDDDDDDDDEGDNLIDDIVEDAMFEFNVSELQELIKNLEEKKSVDAMKRILNGFCSFVELTMEDDKKNKKISKQSVAVANNPAFQQLLHYCLTKLASKITDILNISTKQQTQPKQLKDNKKYIPYRSIFSRYFKYLYGFFKNIDDESMQRLYLIHCKQLVYIILCLNESIKRLYIKRATKLWSSGTPNVRIDAFIFLYEFGKRIHGDNNNNNNGENKELLNLFKFMYQSYVTICKRVSVTTMPGIQFMINCMVEMYNLNPIITYKDCFKRLRSIAFHVKQSIQIMAKHQSKNESTKQYHAKKLKQIKLETIQSVYNWRFINIIRLWSKVLGSHSNRKNSDLHLLYYPFIQICCSVLTLTRSAMYDPGRLKIMQSLLDLIELCQKSTIIDRRIYVPLAPYLISIINNPAFSKKTKNIKNKKNEENEEENEGENEEKEKVFNIHYKIKIGDNDFDTDYLHYSLLNNSIKLMILYFNYYSYSISFPEISFPTQVFLREFLSNSLISNNMKSTVKLLSIKLKENSNWITTKRKTVQFSPKDFEKVHAFLASERFHEMSPLSKFIKTNQFKMLENERINDNDKQDKKIKKINNKNDKIKQKRKARKQKKKKSKIERELKQEQDRKNKKVVDDLKKNYNKDINSKNVEMMGLGDIVKDFELSDDD